MNNNYYANIVVCIFNLSYFRLTEIKNDFNYY